MISENSIKSKFIVDILRSQTDIFYKRAIERFHQYLKSRTGATLKALSSPDYRITSSGEKFQVAASITRQLRFKDIGVRRLYTKPMHSTLKWRVMERLQYGLTEEIREKIINQLRLSIESQNG